MFLYRFKERPIGEGFKMCHDVMRIVFASGSNYAEHVAVTMCSLFENNKEEGFEVYILNEGLELGAWKKLLSIANHYEQKLFSLQIPSGILDGLVRTCHYTKANYYRLFVAEIIPGSRALYLDGDIIVTGKVRELYSTDIAGHYLAAVLNLEFTGHKDLGMREGAGYFNSGVMVINLDLWRNGRIRERVVDLVKTMPWAIQFVDQCGLNGVVNGEWTQLHPKYNLHNAFFECEHAELAKGFPGINLVDAINNPVVIHFSGSVKPWIFLCKHPYRKLYWKYLRLTPFRRIFPADILSIRIARMLLPRVIKKLLRRLVNSLARIYRSA